MVEGSRRKFKIQSKINNELIKYVQVPKVNIKMNPDTRLKGGKQILTHSQGRLLFSQVVVLKINKKSLIIFMLSYNSTQMKD